MSVVAVLLGYCLFVAQAEAQTWTMTNPTDSTSRGKGSRVIGQGLAPLDADGALFKFGNIVSGPMGALTFIGENEVAVTIEPIMMMPNGGAWSTPTDELKAPNGGWNVSPLAPGMLGMAAMRTGDHYAWIEVNNTSPVSTYKHQVYP